MAVMTSIHPDSLSIQEKTQPVPSSEEMALDLDINGHSVHDETTRDSTLPETAVTFDVEPTPSAPVASEVNGINADAFAANEVSTSLDLANNSPPPQQTEEIVTQTTETTILPTGEPIQTTTTIISEVSTSEEVADPLAITDLAEEPITSTIEAPESDLREEPTPITQAEAAEVQAEKHELDLNADPELAAGLNEAGNDSIERDLPDLTTDTISQPIESIPTTVTDEQPIHPASVSDIDLNASSQTQATSISQAPVDFKEEDTAMADVPPSPTKIAREREEDTEDEPSAKRAKTEDGGELATDGAAEAEAAPEAAPEPTSEPVTESAPEPAPAPEVAPTTENGTGPAPLIPAPGDDQPATPYQVKEILKALKHVKNTANGKHFSRPVIEAWPTLAESYLAKVSNPIDLGHIEQKLKDGGYPTILDYKKDVQLVYENAVTYNGIEHSVTKAGITVRDQLFNKIPGPEPIKPEKKPRKSTPQAEAATRTVPSRRQSKGANTATSPTSGAAAQTFALDPSGTPLIRRDSTKAEGGRPKREIHPPKSKDLIYNSARPKKKKFATELKFCEEVLNEMKKPKYSQFSHPFLLPVDPVALGIPDYFKIIKQPMDLSTVATRLSSGEYETAKEFESDIRLIFKNCFKFNPAGSPVAIMGKQFEELFESEWAKKNQYVADHTASAATPDSDGESEEEESEEEEPEEARPGSAEAILNQRLVEEQQKLIDIMTAKKPDQALVQMQQEMVAIVKKQLEAEAAKRQKKPKAKPAKKSAAKKETKTKKSSAYKVKHIGHAEKEQISAGIGQLEGKAMEQAIGLLKIDMPDLDLEQEPELDIDVFSTPTLSKLHDLIVKHVPGIVPAAPEPRATSRSSKPSKPRKNKPMSKTEQEANIQKLKHLSQQFDRAGSNSDDPGRGVVPSVEQDQSSGDESPSDSEED